MSRSIHSNVSKGLEVGLWLISNFVSSFSTLSLACLLSIPSAWLAASLGLSTTVFLLLSIPSLAVSLVLMQRKRVGERIANGLAGPVLGRTIDVGQTQAVQDVHRIWRELQKLNKREQAGWAALYREVSLAKRDVSGFKRAISEREAVLRQLQAWSSSRGKLQKSMKEVSRVVQRDKRLRDKQNRYGAKVANHYPRIRQEYNNLVHSEERDRHMWERKRKELGNAIRAAESAMAPTFWTKLEALWRKQRLATFERLGQKQRAKIGTWLRTPFDPEPALQRQKAMIQKLAGRTIECSDGRVILDVRT